MSYAIVVAAAFHTVFECSVRCTFTLTWDLRPLMTIDAYLC